MARLSNSTLRTVRFYEEEGILRPVKRTDGGHRLFDRGELDRLLFVSDLRTAGLSLDEIKEILELKKGAANAKDAAKEVRRILSARIQELHEKLAVLTRLRDEFAQTSEIIASCLVCQEPESFPDGCRDCAVISAHAHLPRSTRVVWAVGASQARAGGQEKINGELAKSPETSTSEE
ncbi:MAG: MerR family transcriptional regulator [Polyangiaceae bacterium]|nr:MerR family transcriptional regulator [Polyangiaceae bacterium]